MKNKLLLVLFILSLGTVHAQDGPEGIVSKFFKEYESLGASTALDNLYDTNSWMKRSTDAITNLKSQMEGLNEDYVGKYYGHELIVEKKLTESYRLLSYMVKFGRQPVRYTFQFYKPQDTWIIYSFKFDANIDDEIEEAAKLYHLNLD